MESRKQTLLDTDPKKARPAADMSQPKIRKLWLYVGIAIILGLIAAAEIVWLLNGR